MQAHLKNAVMTTGLVLITIFALRQVSFSRDLVDKAISG